MWFVMGIPQGLVWSHTSILLKCADALSHVYFTSGDSIRMLNKRDA